jgi:enamine deaminase RidA (YjgF/YER057c/UK114 family)
MNEHEIAAGLAQTPNYRYADVVGDHLHVAGQVPRDAEGTLVGRGDARAQARQCLFNLFTLVERHDFLRTDIHRLTVYVVGPQQHLTDAWDEVTLLFDGDVPPATLLGVALLGYVDQLVEIDAVIARLSG